MLTPMHRPALASYAPLPLRLILGVGFVIHGYPKIFTSQGMEAISGMLAGVGVPLPALAAYLVGGLEFFGGILLVLGVAVRVVAALGALEMLGAAILVHWPMGFNFMNIVGTAEDGSPVFGMPGYEVNLLYLAGFVSLVLSGAGRVALPWRERRPTEEVLELDT